LDVSQATRNPAQPNPGGGDVVSGCSALDTYRDWLSELHAVAKAILPRPLFRCLALNTGAEIASLGATEIASRNRRIGYTAQHLRILKQHTMDTQSNYFPPGRSGSFPRISRR
jgi:hypothetical protein